MRIPLIIGSALMTLASVAQPKTERASVEWGTELSERETGEFNRIFGQTREAVYMTLNRKKDLLVQKMNSDLMSLYSKVLELELDKKDLALEDIMVVGDRILVFCSVHNKKEDHRTLYMLSLIHI